MFYINILWNIITCFVKDFWKYNFRTLSSWTNKYNCINIKVMQLITLLGQTSSGKSDMAIELAKKLIVKNHRVCITGCDSRQVYKGLDIGTGKIEGGWVDGVFVFQGISHFMIDFVDPRIDYNLQNYIWDFYTTINKAEVQYDFAILVGGTGLYAKAIVEKLELGDVKGEFRIQYINLKKELQALTKVDLQQKVIELKIQINNSDYYNPVRLVSRLLKAEAQKQNWLGDSKFYEFSKQYLFAIAIDQNILKDKIKTRLYSRFNQGLLDEIKKFEYLGEDKFMALGLEYRQGWMYLKGKITQEELQENLLTQNLQYAKRQLTWLKKQKNLIWIRNLEELIKNLEL
jgi:tRNA dimethylallyltransferase